MEPPDLSVDPSRFADYAGSYHDPFLVGDIAVAASGGELVVDIPGLAAPPPIAPSPLDESGRAERLRARLPPEPELALLRPARR